MTSLLAVAAGFVIDRLIGDPIWLYHPVRLIGKWIMILEDVLRKIAGEKKGRLLVCGGVLWFAVSAISVGIPLGILFQAGKVHPAVRFALEAFWCGQILAGKSLKVESRKVYEKLIKSDLPGARYAVSMIVGRDTNSLSEEGVTKAAVETVAENTSDGVIAPLLYLLLGGVPAGFFYKAVNTMDSMVGYKNEKYQYFGRFAARMDDVCNYIPSRIAAVLMIVSAYLLRMDGKNAWRIYLRDRKKSASPNAAQTESVCAGALRVQLCGDAYYFGKLHYKETLGDPLREIRPDDILGAGRLMDGTAVLSLIVFGLLKFALLWLWI
ncbi:MAG: cobalamin biosynthesis protein CobD [Coprococcus sp.]|nr:cobalamin biosynthesis protein CobD [Coprococcus sp.]